MNNTQSKIERLIAELCPNGVEFKELGEVFDIKNGYTPSKAKSEYWTSGTIPWFRMDDIRENGHVLNDSLQHITEEAVKGGRLFPANSIIISTSATIGEHALITVPHLSNQRFTSLALNSEYAGKLNMYFIHYYCYVLDEWCRNNTTKSSFASVEMGGFRKFKIPIPPLKVQEKIVDILDKFTTQLEAELEAELEARKKQYKYYRDDLLNNNDLESTTLDKISKNLDSKRKPVTKGLRTNGEIPYYGASGIVDYVEDYIFDGDYLLISEDGANLLARSTPIAFSACGKSWINNHAHVLEFETYEERRFIEFYLNSIDLTPYISGAAQPKLNKANLNKIPIPKYSFERQKEIVSILDKFDALVNDISIGLPAEIKARRQQYEYYRNKLLTFKKYES
ncbi:restriction endonuclease subunit S [Candidatus Gracilibacteria bacterium]|nr:restriction endonuclease subunit S [Candidatus Gracilibacteria bacterium]